MTNLHKHVKIISKDIVQYFNMHQKNIKILGKFLSIIATIYVIYTAYIIISQLDKTFFSKKLILPLIILILITTLMNYIYAYSYYLFLQKQSTSKIKLKEIINIYIISNIYKYLPSNVMHYVGRNMIASKYQLSQNKVIKSTILEITNIIIVTTSFCIINSLCYMDKFILAGILFIFILFITHLFKITTNFLLIFFTTTINNLIVVFLYNFYNGTFFLNEFERISIIQSISWLAGFITPGAPGGIGIKEFVMIKIASEQFSVILPIIAVMQRLILISSDFIAYGIITIKNTKGE